MEPQAQSSGQILACYRSDTHLGCVANVQRTDSLSLCVNVCVCVCRMKNFERQKSTQEKKRYKDADFTAPYKLSHTLSGNAVKIPHKMRLQKAGSSRQSRMDG